LTPLARRVAAEALGTFALVFFGAGAIMVASKSAAFGQLGIALAFGLVITTMIYALGHISGAHLNPAVSFAFALSRHFHWSRVGAYWLGQCLGAIAAALLLRASLGDIADVGATQPAGSDWQSFLWEVVLTFFLMLVIMAVATDTRAVGEAAAIAIGGTVGLCALVGGPVSGASMNPARSLGPALAAGELGALWIYLLAPLVGAALGALAYQLLRGEHSGAAKSPSGDARLRRHIHPSN
jgi:MIP family channel proteins